MNRNCRLYMACLWVLSIAFLIPSAWAGSPVSARFKDPRPIIIAHRGCWRITAENSISGLKACAERGIDIVEVDLRVTKDGELVLMHDDTLDRMTNLSGRVEDHTAAEFETARLRQGAGGKDALILDECPPTFVDELRAAKGNVILFLDIKIHSARQQIYQTIEREGAQDWVVIPGDAADFGKMPEWARKRIILRAVQCGVAQITSGCFRTLVEAEHAFGPFHPLAIGVAFNTDNFLVNATALKATTGSRLLVWVDPVVNGGRDEEAPSSYTGKVWKEFLAMGLDVIGTNDPIRLSEYLKGKASQR